MSSQPCAVPALLPEMLQAVQPGSQENNPPFLMCSCCSVKGNLTSRAGLSFSLFYLSMNTTTDSSNIPLPHHITVYHVNSYIY